MSFSEIVHWEMLTFKMFTASHRPSNVGIHLISVVLVTRLVSGFRMRFREYEKLNSSEVTKSQHKGDDDIEFLIH